MLEETFEKKTNLKNSDERQRLLVGETQRIIRASKIKAESAVDEYRR